jgi:ankyrin repeat protein
MSFINSTTKVHKTPVFLQNRDVCQLQAVNDVLQLEHACTEGDINLIERILKAELLTKEHFVTALILVCRNGQLGVVKYLCEKGKLNRKDFLDGDNRVIMHICIKGHLDIVEFLWDNKLLIRDDICANHNAALKMASWNGHLKLVKVLCAIMYGNTKLKTQVRWAPNISTTLIYDCPD